LIFVVAIAEPVIRQAESSRVPNPSIHDDDANV